MSRTLPAVAVFDRDDFLTRRWKYAAGEHVSFIAPTTSGKTTLAYQLLGESATPDLPALVVCMKPRDAVVSKWNRELGFMRVRSWPPPPTSWPRNPPGFTLWPKTTKDFHRDDAALREEFVTALRFTYERRRPGGFRKGPWIFFADEVLGLTKDLRMGQELDSCWTRGASNGLGVWAATQAPAHVSLHMYSACHHLFLSREPDKRRRDRFSEIGGVDPDLVKATVARLLKFQWLYIRRSDGAMCIVDR